MTEKLEEIKKKILDAETRLASVYIEIKDLTTRLAEKQTEQETAILEEKPTKNIVNEIMSLQTNLSGSQRVQERLKQTLSSLHEERKAELRIIGRAKAEKAKAEITELMKNIYSLFAEIINKMVELETKSTEYSAGLKAADPKSVLVNQRKIHNFIFTMEAGIKKYLTEFPDDIFADGKLPKPKELEKILGSFININKSHTAPILKKLYFQNMHDTPAMIEAEKQRRLLKK